MTTKTAYLRIVGIALTTAAEYLNSAEHLTFYVDICDIADLLLNKREAAGIVKVISNEYLSPEVTHPNHRTLLMLPAGANAAIFSSEVEHSLFSEAVHEAVAEADCLLEQEADYLIDITDLGW